MIDTSATHTLILRSLLETIPHPPIKKTSTITATLDDAHTAISVYGIVPLYIQWLPKLFGHLCSRFFFDLYLLDEESYRALVFSVL